ncbi:VOC family protein [Paenibacillus methanolicus]|uniref:Catechol 2,3-dioxygenase-like lactoylglutathione lyase family enzyme n=1 Tax=Paenibacillus methanolicus TaxID=582686 RepID=A0A5S5C5E1_9BACL|nr:VOC family protein [Paenibacillus methanolicus]TYP74651.1 catechol 2,3-dioxygenase-like lactoylglutathione lyase family enzyme [Paenibacillus methanolicus]
MDAQLTGMQAEPKKALGKTIQVRLVSDLARSQAYYRDQLGCLVDDWGHAERDEMIVILQQAASAQDVRPNAVSAKRSNYPTDWEGPEYGWDTFVHMGWEELSAYVEEVRGRGARIAIEPFIGAHGGWEFKNAYVLDPDGYSIVLGAMRQAEL